jgi:hypothetical protein
VMPFAQIFCTWSRLIKHISIAIWKITLAGFSHRLSHMILGCSSWQRGYCLYIGYGTVYKGLPGTDMWQLHQKE